MGQQAAGWHSTLSCVFSPWAGADFGLRGVKDCPPLLELHGAADHNVPLAQGAALAKPAKAVGAPAEQVTYTGKAHGFDVSDSDPIATDAIDRVVRFFRSWLQAG